MLTINQSTFVHDLLKKKTLVNCNSINILIKHNNIIKKNYADDYKTTNIKAYQSLIGKWIYLLFGTILNMTFAIR